MLSSSPPPYPGPPGNDAAATDEPTTDVNVTLKDNTIVPEKSNKPNPETETPAALGSTNPPASNPPPIEMKPINPSMAPTTPIKYTTAPNTPLPTQFQSLPMPFAAQAIHPGMNAAGVGAPLPGSATSPPNIQPSMTFPTGPGVMPGYPSAIPVQQMYLPQAAMPLNPMGMPGAMGTNPTQAGGINLVLNTNANAGSNSDSKGGGGGAGSSSQKPAPRPCPKCRLGYITRGQARTREMLIKMLAYGTICCTCLLPLQLLKTNYVDKCSYCGEEYGFRGELFEKPKTPKI